MFFSILCKNSAWPFWFSHKVFDFTISFCFVVFNLVLIPLVVFFVIQLLDTHPHRDLSHKIFCLFYSSSASAHLVCLATTGYTRTHLTHAHACWTVGRSVWSDSACHASFIFFFCLSANLLLCHLSIRPSCTMENPAGSLSLAVRHWALGDGSGGVTEREGVCMCMMSERPSWPAAAAIKTTVVVRFWKASTRWTWPPLPRLTCRWAPSPFQTSPSPPRPHIIKLWPC